MSVYPMQVIKETLDHKGGTKSFHLMRIKNALGHSVLVTRWGKTGVFGQFKVERFETRVEASKAYDKKHREKTSGGYRPEKFEEVHAETESEFRALLGIAYLPNFGIDNLRHLDPRIDVSGVRDPIVEWDENGNKVDNKKRVNPEDYDAALKRQADEARQKEEQAYAANPHFGLF